MPDIVQLSFLLSLFVQPVCGAVLNRERGLGKSRTFKFINKPVIYAIFTLFNTGLIGQAVILNGSWEFTVILYGVLMVYSSYFLGFSPSWGECFPWLKPTYGEKFAPLVREITTKIKGYEYDQFTVDKKVIEWKTTAMSVRWSLYFSFKYAVFSALLLSPLPLVGILAMYQVGKIYRLCFYIEEKEPVEKAEKFTGAYILLVDVLLIYSSLFVSFKLN